MGEEIKPFTGSVSRHYPIEGMENPTTKIRHEAGPRDQNIKKNADKNDEVILPKTKQSNRKINHRIHH